MSSTDRRTERRAAAVLVAAVMSLVAAVGSGLALVPRVRLVEVLLVIFGAMGAGAGFTAALLAFRGRHKGQRTP